MGRNDPTDRPTRRPGGSLFRPGRNNPTDRPTHSGKGARLSGSGLPDRRNLSTAAQLQVQDWSGSGSGSGSGSRAGLGVTGSRVRAKRATTSTNKQGPQGNPGDARILGFQSTPTHTPLFRHPLYLFGCEYCEKSSCLGSKVRRKNENRDPPSSATAS